MGLVRLVVFGFLGLSVVYFAISWYSSSVRREKLENAWDAENPESSDETARDAYVAEGMEAYRSGLRPKLILLVYIIPAGLVIASLIITNWN